MHAPLRLAVVVVAAVVGCATQDIPQAHRGMIFDRTGAFAFYSGGRGFSGSALGPGTYFTGWYDELRMVDCSMVTEREPLTALTRDGVQFGLDIYVRFSADCSDEAIRSLLGELTPDVNRTTISTHKVYETFVRPAIGEAVREVVSPYRANDLNEKREELLGAIRKRFMDIMLQREKRTIVVREVNLSNLDFPDAMDAANVERAVQAVMRDKAIAERERVQAEIETMTMRRTLAEREGDVAAARIDRIGVALRRNPEYLQYDLQLKLPEIYRTAGAAGNLVLAAPNAAVLMQPHPRLPVPMEPINDGPPARRANPMIRHERSPDATP